MLKFTGHGSSFNTELGNNSAYIKHGSILFMIDCGSNIFDRLLKGAILDDTEHIYVLLTHTHPDHVGSLGDLIFYGYYAMGELGVPKVTVLSPFDIEIRSLLKLNGVRDEFYNLKQFYKEMRLTHKEDFEIDIEAVQATHVDELNCYGYVLKYLNQTAYYSGDSNSIPFHILQKLESDEFNYFYQDTCKLHYDGNVHLSLQNLDKLVKSDYRNLVYCMHLDNGFDVDEAKNLGFNVVTSIFNQ